MFNKLRVTCALIFLVAGMTACLDTPTEEEATTEQGSELCDGCGLLDPGTSVPSCSAACGDTAACTTPCTDASGAETTCYAAGSCDPVEMLERKAREGRNPLTGKTIQIKA